MKRRFIEINTLITPELVTILTGSPPVKAVAIDFDFTLAPSDIGHEFAMRRIEARFGSTLAVAFNGYFLLNWDASSQKQLSSWKDLAKYERFLSRSKALFEDPEQSPKQWSRKTWAILAGLDTDTNLTPKEVDQISELYWSEVANHTRLYDDANAFLSLLKQLKIPVFVMTGSDSIMEWVENGKLRYNPEHSAAYKLRRLEIVANRVESIIIGDPFDKPHPNYFERLFEEIWKVDDTIQKQEVLVIGDSFTADINYPLESLGCLAAHLVRQK